MMNSLIEQYYSVGENRGSSFQEVLFLTEKERIGWEEISEKSPDLPRGWFELSRVSPQDRIEFTRDFWLDRLPYHPKTQGACAEFFDLLDDVAIVLSRESEGPLFAELAYSLEDNRCFFRGKPPCPDPDLSQLKNEIPVSLPRDYLAFLKIHNGFGKLSEMGLLQVGEIADARRKVMEMILLSDSRVKFRDQWVDAGSLIPFYEALGLSSYQCFYSDWYPGNEMGNVYFSGIDYTISDHADTFLEWLMAYLQGMNVSP